MRRGKSAESPLEKVPSISERSQIHRLELRGFVPLSLRFSRRWRLSPACGVLLPLRGIRGGAGHRHSDGFRWLFPAAAPGTFCRLPFLSMATKTR